MKKATDSANAFKATLKNIAVNVGIGVLISLVGQLVESIATADSRLKETAQEIGSTFSSSKSEIEKYKSQIEDLHKTIDDSSSSYEDVANARKQLLSIQNEMIEKYKNEKTSIQDITNAINDQSGAFEKLTQDQWQQAKNDFNKSDGFFNKIGDNARNGFGGYSDNYDRMISEMENGSVDFHFIDEGTEAYKKFTEQLKELYGLQATINERGDMSYELTDNINDIYDKLQSIQSLANNFGIEYTSSLTDAINSTKDLSDSYQDMYNNYLLYDKIFTNDDYTQAFNNITDAYNVYEKAFESNDDTAIEEAKQKFAQIVSDSTQGIGDETIVRYFQEMYPDLQDVVASWQFEVDFKANKNGLQESISDALSKFNSSEDVLNFSSGTASDDQKEAYAILENCAKQYHTSIEQLITDWKDLGLVQSQVKDDLVNKLAPSTNTATAGVSSVMLDSTAQASKQVVSDWVKSLTDEEAQLANSKEFENALNERKEALNGTALSAQDYTDALQKVKDTQNESSDTDTFEIPDADTLQQQISDLNSTIDSIQSAYDTLTSACEEYNTNGGQLSIDTIQSLLSLSDEYLACLQVENGQLSLNADAMAQLAQAKLDEAQATAVTQAMTELQAIANGEAAQSTTNYITGNAALMSSLAQLSGSYDGVAQAAMTAAQAQELSAQISAASAKDKTATENVMKGLDNKLKMIQITKKSISAGNFGTVAKKASSSGSGSKKSGSGSGNSAKDAEKEAEEYVDKYMSYQKAMLEGGKTDYQTYTKNVKSMLDDMYNSGKISASKYFSSVKDMIDEQKTIYEKALKAVTSRLEKEIDLWQAKIDALKKENDKLNDQKDTYDGILSAVEDVIDAETDRYQNLIDNLDKANDKLNKSKDDKDSILSAIADVYDEQIDALNKQSDALDEQIKKLQDANDELDKQYRKEKAIYALEQAQRLRNKKVYMDGKGYIYTQDQEAIRDAKKDLADIETDEAISKLEKEKEKLSDAIANLEKYKELWAEVSNAYEKETNKQLAIAQYGKDFEKTILLNRESDIEAFKNSYIAIQKELDNNQSLIDSYNEKVDYYNKLKEQWSSISDAYDANANKQAAIAQWGSGFEQMILSGRIQSITAFKDQYLAVQSQINNNEQLINSYNEKVDYYNKLKDQWGNTTSVYEDELNAQYAAQVLGAGWETNVLNGRLDVMRKFTNEYKALCQQQADYAINAANAEVTARNNANSGAMSGGTDVSGGSGGGGSSAPISSGGKKTIAYIVVDLSGNQLYSSTNQTTAMNWIKRNGYVISRTDNQKATTSVVYFYVRKNTRGGGGGNTMHLARYSEGGIVTASKGTLVTNYDNPLNVIAQSMGEDTMIAAKKGERILTPEQNEMWEKWTKAIPKLMSYLPNIEYASKGLSTSKLESKLQNSGTNNSVSIGTIHVHEVQNVDAFTDAVIKEFPGKMIQAMHRK